MRRPRGVSNTPRRCHVFRGGAGRAQEGYAQALGDSRHAAAAVGGRRTILLRGVLEHRAQPAERERCALRQLSSAAGASRRSAAYRAATLKHGF